MGNVPLLMCKWLAWLQRVINHDCLDDDLWASLWLLLFTSYKCVISKLFSPLIWVWTWFLLFSQHSHYKFNQVVKVILHKVALPPHTYGLIAFARLHQWASPFNTWFPALTNLASETASQLVQPFLRSSWHGVPILYNGLPFSPSKLAPRVGIWTPSRVQLSPHPKWNLDRFSRFCRSCNHDRQTDRATLSVAVGWGHINVVLWCRLTVGTFIFYSKNSIKCPNLESYHTKVMAVFVIDRDNVLYIKLVLSL